MTHIKTVQAKYQYSLPHPTDPQFIQQNLSNIIVDIDALNALKKKSVKATIPDTPMWALYRKKYGDAVPIQQKILKLIQLRDFMYQVYEQHRRTRRMFSEENIESMPSLNVL